MEGEFFPRSPEASSSPENRYGITQFRNHTRHPWINNFHTSNPSSFESAFSRLSISPNPLFRSQLLDPPAAALRPGSISLPTAQNSIWAQAESSTSYDNGPFGFTRAHQRINVGPEAFSGVGPYYGAAADHYQLPLVQQRRELFDTGRENYGCSILHGKIPYPRFNIPDLPPAQQRNFGALGPSLYSNNQLHKWQQQMWSGSLNSKLDEGLSEEQIEILVPKVMESVVELMRDQFGSHFVPKLFAVCNENQRTRIMRSLTRNPPDFISLCVNAYGARAIQKLLEKMVTPQQMSLVVSALTAGGTLTVSTDPSGQHVIKFCVKNFFPEHVEKLLNDIANNYYQIATNKSGCCVLQSCVEHPHTHGEATQHLISKIIANAIHLSEDPYGNYVVQHLIGMQMPRVTADLVKQFQGHFVSLSCNKFASHVVERFLKDSGEHYSSRIIRELVEDRNASMLLLDPFGNFVIQSALSMSKGDLLNALRHLIQVNAPSMQSNLYGKKILAWCEKKCIGCVV